MPLTGVLTTSLFWVVAAAVFVAGLVWPRSAGAGPRTRRARAYVRRAGMQLAVVITTLLATAGSLNAQYDWYSSWSDLGTVFGATADAGTSVVGAAAGDPAPAMPSGAPAKPSSAPAKPSGSAASWPSTLPALNPNPGPNGQYVTVSVAGPASKVTSSVVIWLPQSYMQAASPQRSYPVLEVFHGVPGSPQEYSHDIDLGTMVAGLVSSKNLKDTILVMPDSTPNKVDTECVNGGAQGPAMEDWLTKDVPDWIQHTLRVDHDRSSWATMGLSTGGFCSMMATMLHPQTYGAAIELGGYLTPQFDQHYRPFAKGSPEWNRYDLPALAAATPPPVKLWVETSKTDTLSYPENARLIAAAKAPMSVTTDILQDAGHRMSVWVGVMPNALTWLGTNVSGFHP